LGIFLRIFFSHPAVNSTAGALKLALRVSFMTLPQLVDRYLAVAGQYGRPVALSSFALPSDETERLFSSFDEDYHISRFFRFSSANGQAFSIDGVPATHVSIDAEIQSVL
jgi:hypothetical protein